MLGFIPGLLHAWYIIAKYPENDYEPVSGGDPEHGRVTYIVVQDGSGRQQRVSKNSRVGQAAVKNQGYGTTAPMAPGPQGAAAAPQIGQSTNGTWGGGEVNGGEGSSGGAVPPSYAEAVKGDNKVQNP